MTSKICIFNHKTEKTITVIASKWCKFHRRFNSSVGLRADALPDSIPEEWKIVENQFDTTIQKYNNFIKENVCIQLKMTSFLLIEIYRLSAFRILCSVKEIFKSIFVAIAGIESLKS